VITFLARLIGGNDFPFAIAFWMILAAAIVMGATITRRKALRSTTVSGN